MDGQRGRERPAIVDRGQAETMGVVLVVAITLIGATVAMALGATAINEARLDSQEEGIQNALTQLDSRAAMVGLGESTAQFIELSSGSYRVDPNAGWMKVSHYNHSGNETTEVLFNESLGAVVYESGDKTIAYQGGGVWQSTDNGSSMVSPPEFHYRSATLTLPVIRVLGGGGAAGGVTAKVTADPGVNRVYPDATTNYNGTSRPYANPISEGNVTVEVHSQYYQAWAAYFESRTDGEITVFDSNQTVRVLLVSPTILGDFQMPNEGQGMTVQDLGEEHPINEFEITLKADGDGQNFQEMHWAYHAEEDGQELEIHIFSPGKCSGGGSYNDELDLSIYFYNGSGGLYEGWQNSSVDPATNPDVDVDCDAKEMTIDLMGSTELEYKAIDITGSDNKWFYGNQISDNDVDPMAVLDQHDIDTASPRDGTYNASAGETDELGFLVNHYVQRLGPTVELKVTDGPGGSSRIDEGESSGTLDYTQGGGDKFITFLHITENRVTVELE